VANMDPAAEDVKYDMAFDIRDLISVDDVMEELGLGPNGGLLYCMEYLLDNLDWLQEHLDSFDDDEYLILDCPGQLELYTHVPVMRRVIDGMRLWGYESSMVGVFVVDATFVTDASKFISGALLSLSAMVALELPHVNILSKCDLVSSDTVERILNVESAQQLWDMEENRIEQQGVSADDIDQEITPAERLRIGKLRQQRNKRSKLTQAICSLLDDYTMVGFLPLNITDEDSLEHVLAHVDHTIQYGEDLEVRGAEENIDDEENEDD